MLLFKYILLCITLSVCSVYVYFHYYFYCLVFTQDPADTTFCEGSNAVLKCVIFDNSTEQYGDSTGWYRRGFPSYLLPDNLQNTTRDGNVVSSVLTIKNVSLNDSGNEYFCLILHDSGFLLQGPFAMITVIAGKHMIVYRITHTYLRMYIRRRMHISINYVYKYLLCF